MYSTTTKTSTVTIDASGKVLGRLASEVALLLRGKTSASFSPWKEPDLVVTVYNLKNIKITGKKSENKVYYHHTGYLGSLRTRTYKELFEKDATIVFQKAVRGMLPANRLRRRLLKRLKLYAGEVK